MNNQNSTRKLYENPGNQSIIPWYVLLSWQSQRLFENGTDIIDFFLQEQDKKETIWKKANKKNMCTSRKIFFRGLHEKPAPRNLDVSEQEKGKNTQVKATGTL